MQLIDLSDVHDFSAARFLLYWLVASIVAIIVAYSIGQENKLKWFRQRKSNGFMVRRGVFGNFSLLGVPNSKKALPLLPVSLSAPCDLGTSCICHSSCFRL